MPSIYYIPGTYFAAQDCGRENRKASFREFSTDLARLETKIIFFAELQHPNVYCAYAMLLPFVFLVVIRTALLVM